MINIFIILNFNECIEVKVMKELTNATFSSLNYKIAVSLMQFAYPNNHFFMKFLYFYFFSKITLKIAINGLHISCNNGFE